MNLVYYLIYGNNKKNEYLLESSIKTLINKGNYKDDILFISDKDNFDFILNLNIPNKIFILEISNIKILTLNKYYIYNFKHILKYDNILYMDIDILITKDINFIFDLNKNNNKFKYSYDDINNNNCNANYLNNNVKQTKTINGGLFLFKQNKTNLDICKEIYSLTIDEKGECMDQPTINDYFLKNNNYYTDELTPYVYFNYHKDINLSKLFIHLVQNVYLSKKYIKIYELFINNNITYNDIMINFNFNIILDKNTNKIFIWSIKNDFINTTIIIKMNDKINYFNNIDISSTYKTYMIPSFKINNYFSITIIDGKNKYYKNNINFNTFHKN